MNKIDRKIAGIDDWNENFGNGMEFRGSDNVSWYDLSVNYNSLPCETGMAIIVTSWFGQLKWLTHTLRKYRETGAFVILAYDNPFYGWSHKYQDMNRYMPNPKHYLLANSVVHKHITYDADKRNGWVWDVLYASGIIKRFPNIKYVYVTNGDCICEKPEGFKELINILGDADFMTGQETENSFHTADMIFKREAFDKLFDYLYEMFRVPVLGSRSPEGSMKEAVDNLGLVHKTAPVQPLDTDGTVDMYASYGQDSTWKQVVGFRNLYHEYENAGNDGKELYHLRDYVDSYFDWIYWSGEERETICKYWKTGDRRYLYQFWDRWEDSDYNRLYYPLEYYGKEPIWESQEKTSKEPAGI